MEHFVVISGCSGGGKSTLLAELARRGYSTIAEPGRRIVVDEQRAKGDALPWQDMQAFLKRAYSLALEDRDRQSGKEVVFFDRGLIDAASALSVLTGEAWLEPLRKSHRYHSIVFMTPPWPEIYVQDRERRHDMSAAQMEYRRLLKDYPAIGYELREVPKAPVGVRAEFVLDALRLPRKIRTMP